jgi:hypothetical protein
MAGDDDDAVGHATKCEIDYRRLSRRQTVEIADNQAVALLD